MGSINSQSGGERLRERRRSSARNLSAPKTALPHAKGGVLLQAEGRVTKKRPWWPAVTSRITRFYFPGSSEQNPENNRAGAGSPQNGEGKTGILNRRKVNENGNYPNSRSPGTCSRLVESTIERKFLAARPSGLRTRPMMLVFLDYASGDRRVASRCRRCLARLPATHLKRLPARCVKDNRNLN